MRPALPRRPLATCHPGLFYELFDTTSDEERSRTLDLLRSHGPPEGYERFFEAWQAGGGLTADFVARSRLLVGHGGSSMSEVGLTLHHTWGIPILPGPALKGVASSWVARRWGTVDADWAGPVWEEGQLTSPGGPSYVEVFGRAGDGRGDIGLQGCVAFEDALARPQTEPYLCRDVLTPHHRAWYEGTAGEPADWEDPIPIPFLTVAPKTAFSVRISGPRDWAELAMNALEKALLEDGIGGKTVAGYGRLSMVR